jgi:hypothetical protein
MRNADLTSAVRSAGVRRADLGSLAIDSKVSSKVSLRPPGPGSKVDLDLEPDSDPEGRQLSCLSVTFMISILSFLSGNPM